MRKPSKRMRMRPERAHSACVLQVGTPHRAERASFGFPGERPVLPGFAGPERGFGYTLSSVPSGQSGCARLKASCAPAFAPDSSARVYVLGKPLVV